MAFGKDLLFTATYSQNPRREDVQSTLRHLKRVWEALTKCEREALHNRWLQKRLDAFLWPAGVWIREVFVSLPENAQWLHDELSDVFSSFGTKRTDSTSRVTTSDWPSQARCSHWRGGKIWRTAIWQKKLVGSTFPSSRRIATCTQDSCASLLSRPAEEDSFSLGRQCVKKWMAQRDWYTRPQTSARMSGPRH